MKVNTGSAMKPNSFRPIPEPRSASPEALLQILPAELGDAYGRPPTIWRYSSSVNARQVSEVKSPLDVTDRSALAMPPSSGASPPLPSRCDQRYQANH
jgi:hypothetical protein